MKVSFVVPCYNVANYVERCVDSILAQTEQDFEVILVDDGSKDSTGAILDAYACKDKRIRVIHQSNGGLSAARNAGIDAVKGDYVCFVDSDDVIHPQYLETLLNPSGSNAISLVNYAVFTDKTGIPEISRIGKEKQITQQQVMQCFLKNTSYISACCKLFPSALFFTKDKLRFPIGKRYEDFSFVYKLYMQCESFYVRSDGLYFYYMRTGSIMHTKLKPQTLDIYFSCNDVEANLQKLSYWDNIKDAFLERKIKNYLMLYCMIASYEKEQPTKQRQKALKDISRENKNAFEIKNEVTDYLKKQKLIPLCAKKGVGIKAKIILLLYKIWPGLLVKMVSKKNGF